MNPDSSFCSVSEASLQQRYFNAVDWWWKANSFCWQEGPREILLVSLEVKCVIPTWVYGRPLPSFSPWGFLLVWHLLSCLGYCKKGKNCSSLREIELCFGKDTHIDFFFLNFERVQASEVWDKWHHGVASQKCYLFCWNLDGFLILLLLLSLSVYSA